MKEFELGGKIAVITGAGRGIGKAIALALAEAGADTVVAARTKNEIEQTANEIKKMGRESIAIPADLTKSSDVQQIADLTIKKYGRVDILVCQAGRGGAHKPLVPLPDYHPAWSEGNPDFFTPISEKLWHQVMDTNLTSIFLCVRAFGSHMIRQNKGKVINMSSFVGTKAYPNQLVYSTSKAAVSMLTRCLALEWAKYKINVNAIGPGYVLTRMTEPLFKNEVAKKRLLRSVPLNRFGEPREVGLLAVYLASDASNYMTGQTIYLDGGVLA